MFMEVSNRNCLCNEVVLWKSGEMKSDCGVVCCVVGNGLHLERNNGLDDFKNNFFSSKG